jgi:hypothetical protein
MYAESFSRNNRLEIFLPIEIENPNPISISSHWIKRMLLLSRSGAGVYPEVLNKSHPKIDASSIPEE